MAMMIAMIFILLKISNAFRKKLFYEIIHIFSCRKEYAIRFKMICVKVIIALVLMLMCFAGTSISMVVYAEQQYNETYNVVENEDLIIINGDGNILYYKTESLDLEEQNSTEEDKSACKLPNITFSIPIPTIIFRRKKHKNGKSKH